MPLLYEFTCGQVSSVILKTGAGTLKDSSAGAWAWSPPIPVVVSLKGMTLSSFILKINLSLVSGVKLAFPVSRTYVELFLPHPPKWASGLIKCDFSAAPMESWPTRGPKNLRSRNGLQPRSVWCSCFSCIPAHLHLLTKIPLRARAKC